MGEGYGAVGGAEVYADCGADLVRHGISGSAVGALVAPPWGVLRKVFIVNDIGLEMSAKYSFHVPYIQSIHYKRDKAQRMAAGPFSFSSSILQDWT